ncbi:uncharacterized protein EI90DRAFT_3116734 [Cantharellus anzutake]|uniref:uncharacterized protein n=1 Tax=Cantharellus anzutake TaxID=1750568 RepID=UPI001903B882|nr:uncharacterized protein EI90DRAFT_3116734 [Cantharellus anzutake]KAF8341632.1 hypothetical protein EI90DRAFT_3116734 [Cantharellus anzutake]
MNPGPPSSNKSDSIQCSDRKSQTLPAGEAQRSSSLEQLNIATRRLTIMTISSGSIYTDEKETEVMNFHDIYGASEDNDHQSVDLEKDFSPLPDQASDSSDSAFDIPYSKSSSNHPSIEAASVGDTHSTQNLPTLGSPQSQSPFSNEPSSITTFASSAYPLQGDAEYRPTTTVLSAFSSTASNKDGIVHPCPHALARVNVPPCTDSSVSLPIRPPRNPSRPLLSLDGQESVLSPQPALIHPSSSTLEILRKITHDSRESPRISPIKSLSIMIKKTLRHSKSMPGLDISHEASEQRDHKLSARSVRVHFVDEDMATKESSYIRQYDSCVDLSQTKEQGVYAPYISFPVTASSSMAFHLPKRLAGLPVPVSCPPNSPALSAVTTVSDSTTLVNPSPRIPELTLADDDTSRLNTKVLPNGRPVLNEDDDGRLW